MIAQEEGLADRVDPADPSLLHVISLGAGVQSTTVALMAARGLISPLPACAIFADTGEEPGAVYQRGLGKEMRR